MAGWRRLGASGEERIQMGYAYVPEELAYTEFTGTVTITATTDAGGDTIVTAPTIVLDGATKIIVEYYCPLLEVDFGAAGAAISTVTNLWDDTTDLGRLGTYRPELSAGGSGYCFVKTSRELTPAAGSHTFKIKGYKSAATGTVKHWAGAGGVATYMPGFIRIVRASNQIIVPAADPAWEGSAPPSSPYHGQRWLLSPTAGVLWEFRYNVYSASAYKWEFVGGGPWTNAKTTASTFTSTSFGDAADGTDPKVTLARAGDYRIDHGALVFCNTAARYVRGGVVCGAVAADVDVNGFQFYIVTGNTDVYQGARSFQVTAAAGDVAKQQYMVHSASTGSCQARWLSVIPVRIA